MLFEKYYQISYNGHVFSVPAMLDWLHALFACEILDANARLLTVESADETVYLANYFAIFAHPATHSFFWSGGHRGVLGNEQLQLESQPMDFSHFATTLPNFSLFPSGHCVYTLYYNGEMRLATASWELHMAYACDIPAEPRSLSEKWPWG